LDKCVEIWNGQVLNNRKQLIGKINKRHSERLM
jgi:hypothetical protein